MARLLNVCHHRSLSAIAPFHGTLLVYLLVHVPSSIWKRPTKMIAKVFSFETMGDEKVTFPM